MTATREYATEYVTAYGLAVNGTDAQRAAACFDLLRIVQDARREGQPLDVLAIEDGYRRGLAARQRARYAAR